MSKPYLIFAALLLILTLAWILRARARRVRSLQHALRFKPVPAHKLISILTRMPHGDVGLASFERTRSQIIEETWAAIGGYHGILMMRSNATQINRALAAGREEYGEMFATDDMEYIEDLVLQLHHEGLFALGEAFVSRIYPVSHVHGYNVTRLYCDIVGWLEAVADCYQSPALKQLISRL